MNKPNVFTDFHHASLLYSLILLFEKRLGGKVYRPIGMEWADNGFWNIYDHPATRLQFLTLNQGYKPIDGTEPLNNIKKIEDGVYYCQDIDSGYYNKAITLDTFYNLPIDIVIASVPQHILPFKKLCESHPNKPKLIFQIGNSWTVEAGLAPNIMASAKINGIPENINFVSYHQEFDLNLFSYTEPKENKNIYSFVNCFNIASHFSEDWKLFTRVEREMPTWNFKSFGGQCRDGAKHGSEELSQGIKDSRFIWNNKNGGDGYGHVIFNASACGRPLITKKSYYNGKFGEVLMQDGYNSVCIDNLTIGEIINKIDYYNEPERYSKLSKNLYETFKENANFDKEEVKIRDFLDKLK